MRRNALLTVTGCKTGRFDTLASRKQLPFSGLPEDNTWSDYSAHDAGHLRLMIDAPKGVDVETARFIAAEATHTLGDLPFYHTEKVDLYAAALFLEDGTRVPLSGTLSEIAALADPVEGIFADYKHRALVMLNATMAYKKVQDAMCKLGLPQSEWLFLPPADLTGLPDWFVKIETARRDFLNDWSDPRAPGGLTPLREFQKDEAT